MLLTYRPITFNNDCLRFLVFSMYSTQKVQKKKFVQEHACRILYIFDSLLLKWHSLFFLKTEKQIHNE